MFSKEMVPATKKPLDGKPRAKTSLGASGKNIQGRDESQQIRNYQGPSVEASESTRIIGVEWIPGWRFACLAPFGEPFQSADIFKGVDLREV